MLNTFVPVQRCQEGARSVAPRAHHRSNLLRCSLVSFPCSQRQGLSAMGYLRVLSA